MALRATGYPFRLELAYNKRLFYSQYVVVNTITSPKKVQCLGCSLVNGMLFPKVRSCVFIVNATRIISF